MPIRLCCVMERGKLRVRFHSYVDAERKVYQNVYHNGYNCQFPRALRVHGCMYEIDDDALQLCNSDGRVPFYRVTTTNIRVVNEVGEGLNPVVSPDQVFEVVECVVCMDAMPSIIGLPCAHLCMCGDCFGKLPSKGRSGRPNCPLCRREIVQTLLRV